VGAENRLDAVIAVPFDTPPEQRAAASDAGTRAGLGVLAVVTEPIAAALGRLPSFKPATRPVRLLVVAPGRFVAVVEWVGTNLTTVAADRGGLPPWDAARAVETCDKVLSAAKQPWKTDLEDVAIVGDDAEMPGVCESLAERWGRSIVLPPKPELAVAYGAAKVGYHLHKKRGT
jgi:molecular chaperone DnaK (HSP70)